MGSSQWAPDHTVFFGRRWLRLGGGSPTPPPFFAVVEQAIAASHIDAQLSCYSYHEPGFTYQRSESKGSALLFTEKTSFSKYLVPLPPRHATVVAFSFGCTHTVLRVHELIKHIDNVRQIILVSPAFAIHPDMDGLITRFLARPELTISLASAVQELRESEFQLRGNIEASLRAISKQASITVLHSDNDPVVDLSEWAGFFNQLQIDVYPIQDVPTPKPIPPADISLKELNDDIYQRFLAHVKVGRSPDTHRKLAELVSGSVK